MPESQITFASLSAAKQEFFKQIIELCFAPPPIAAAEWAAATAEEKTLYADAPALALLAADVDRVKDYVFESARLPEMRGASLILDLLNVKDSEDESKWGNIEIEYASGKKAPVKGLPQLLFETFELPRQALIYASGGGALLLAPAEMAAAIQATIEAHYLKTTLTATITVVYELVTLAQLRGGLAVPDDWRDVKAKTAKGAAARLVKSNGVLADDYRPGFGQLYSLLGYRLRRAKDSRATAPLFEVSPFTERCAFCGLRPAFTLPKFAEEPICEVCFRKRQEHWFEALEKKQRKAAHSFYVNRFTQYLDDSNRAGASFPYWDGVLAEKEGAHIDSPPDLKAIANAARESRVSEYIGIIYADGNDLGAKLEELQTPLEFRNFARNTRKVVETAVFHALGKLLDRPYRTEREYQNRKGQPRQIEHIYHPFEIISIGGDDVYLFVPADLALEIALSICSEVKERSRDPQQSEHSFTLSAGVLIAHVTTPVYFSREIVEGLLKHAKQRSKSEGKKAISTIDFQVITADTAIGREIGAYRKQAYRHERLDEWLTARPYTLDELEKMLELVRDLKEQNLPLAQLYALREAVTRGPQPRASNFYNYQRSRSGEFQTTYQLLHQFLENWAAADTSHLPLTIASRLPFTKVQSGFHQGKLLTPLVDLVEIYRFVRQREKPMAAQTTTATTPA